VDYTGLQAGVLFFDCRAGGTISHMDATIPLPLQKAMETDLSERFCVSVRMSAIQNIWPSWVFRCTLSPLQPTFVSLPTTVIVRLPRETGARSEMSLLGNEQAALELLADVDGRFTPRFFAGGMTKGYLVSEDLGTGPSLLDILLGRNQPLATQGVLGFAHSLGTLHANTARRQSEIDLSTFAVPVHHHWQQVQDTLVNLGLLHSLPASRQLLKEITEIDHLLNDSNDYLALSSGDTSVVNCKVRESPIHTQFFDFESACFRHALVDASVLRFLYPTGGPAWYLPQSLVRQAETLYRTALMEGCPSAKDDANFETSMAAATFAWVIHRLVRLPRVDAGPDRDTWSLVPPGWSAPLPLRSRRRQLVSILETGTSTTHFEALRDWCEQLTTTLRIHWPEAMEELPVYPAFSI
jgi:hypothetical protein